MKLKLKDSQDIKGEEKEEQNFIEQLKEILI